MEFLLRSCGCFKGERQRAVCLAWTVVELGNRRPPFSKLGLRIRRRGRRCIGTRAATRRQLGRSQAEGQPAHGDLKRLGELLHLRDVRHHHAGLGHLDEGVGNTRHAAKFPTRKPAFLPPLDQPGRQALPTRCRGRLARHFDTIGEQAQRPCQLLNGIKSCDSPAGLQSPPPIERALRSSMPLLCERGPAGRCVCLAEMRSLSGAELNSKPNTHLSSADRLAESHQRRQRPCAHRARQ